MALLWAESQVHILYVYLFILEQAASWVMLFLWQMVGAQTKGKPRHASTFKISASITWPDIPLDIASHVAIFSNNVVVKYMLLAVGGNTAVT